LTKNLHNINIERAILSSIIFNPQSFDDLAASLNSEDFYLPFHQNLFIAMEDLEQKDLPIDEEFLQKELEKKKQFNENLLIDILTTNPLSNITAYVDELKDKAVKRKLNHLSAMIKDEVLDDDDSNNIVDTIQQNLYSITQDSITADFKDSKEMMISTLEHIKEMKERENSGVVGVNTGYNELNKLTSGFGDGDLIIIAARPAMGKTAFCLNLAQRAIDDNRGVAFFSLEMPAEHLVIRMLSAKTSIPLQRLKIGNMSNEEWTSLTDATDEMGRKKFFVDDDGVINIHQVRSKLRKLKTQHPEISLAIIDYLQLMNGTGKKDRHLEVSEISRGLKLLARELNIPIIALSQLNRGLEGRSDKRPMLSDLRESGSIEQDADMIMFVYRDDVYRIREEKEKEKKAVAEGGEYKSNIEEKLEEDAEIIIGKNRNGPVGIANLIFQKQFTRFTEANSKIDIEVVFENDINMPRI